MTDKKIWFVTGAARGMGVDIANAARAAGHAVVATARSADAVTAALGTSGDVLAVQLDITDPSVDAAITAAVAPSPIRHSRHLKLTTALDGSSGLEL